MKIDWTSLFTLLGHPPGDLVYHLVVGSALLVVLIAAFSRNNADSPANKRRHLLVGMALLFVLQAFLAALNLLGAPSVSTAAMLWWLVEALIQALTTVWLIWTLVDRDESFVTTGLGIFLSLAMILWGIAAVSLLFIQPPYIPESPNWMFAVWDLGGLALAALGCVILWVKRPQAWQVGTAILLTIGLGYGLPLLFADPAGVRPGALRLAMTIAIPWTLALLQRLHKQEGLQKQMKAPIGRQDVTTLLVDELLQFSQLTDKQEKFDSAARALSLSLVADMCYLVQIDTGGNPVLLAGYDLIREQTLPTATLSRDDLPNILRAWDAQRAYCPGSPPLSTHDAATLADTLNYHYVGNVLAYPLGKPVLKGGVIFLSPYTQKTLAANGITLMAEIEENLSHFLFEPGLRAEFEAELDAVRQQAENVHQENEALTGLLSESQDRIASQYQQIRQLKARYQVEKLKMVKEIDACQEKIIKLSAQAATQKQDLENLEDLKAQIRRLVAERQHLERDLAQANDRIRALEGQLAQPPTEPLRSEVLSLDALEANLSSSFGPRCEHKDVNLDIANPDGRQLIKTHAARLQMLIHHLLENALLASKPEGSLHLRLKLSFETGMLQVQVTDSGEGLSPEEQRALFEAMEDPPAGIGSLADVREAVRLVQLMNAKIWLRSKPGAFTTFRVQLPVRILD